MRSGWVTKKLGEVFEIERGGSPRPIDSFLTDAPDGINWIKIGDTKNVRKYITKTEEKIKPEGVRRSRMVYEGDFILSNSMSFGRPYIMKTSGCIHDGWLVLRDRESNVDRDYLYHVLSSDLVFRQFNRLAAGSTVRNLNIGLVKSVEIPIPSLPEQRRIVGILDEAFDGIAAAKANAEKNVENSRALFENYRQAILSQRSGGYVERSFSEVCEISSVLVDPREDDYVSMLHVGGANIESKTGRLIGLKTARAEGLISGKFVFDDSMVLYSKIRPYLMKVARPDFHGLCSADIYPLSVKESRLDRDYLFHLLLSSEFTDYANVGSARAGMPKVNRDHLFAFRVFLPPVAKQKRLAAKLDDLHEETQRLESVYRRKLAALDELKKSLLHRAFSGEL